MRFYFTRTDSLNRWQVNRCQLIVEGKDFVVYLCNRSKEISLNDGNFHSITEIKGEIINLSIDNHGISIKFFNKKSENSYFKDMIFLYFNEPMDSEDIFKNF